MPRIDAEHSCKDCVAAEKVWSKNETTANSIDADYVPQMEVLDLGPLMELRRCRYTQKVDIHVVYIPALAIQLKMLHKTAYLL